MAHLNDKRRGNLLGYPIGSDVELHVDCQRKWGERSFVANIFVILFSFGYNPNREDESMISIIFWKLIFSAATSISIALQGSRRSDQTHFDSKAVPQHNIGVMIILKHK